MIGKKLLVKRLKELKEDRKCLKFECNFLNRLCMLGLRVDGDLLILLESQLYDTEDAIIDIVKQLKYLERMCV
jgi:hypothetical protein